MFKLVVLTCLVAAASAGYVGFGGIAAPLAYTAPLAYSAPFYAPNNYRGPLSLAPGQPANILAADGRPLDTLDVNLDRSAHLTAKALSGVHFLKKRSAPLFAAPVVAPARLALTHGSLIAPAPLAYSAPLAHTYASPLHYAAPLIHY